MADIPNGTRVQIINGNYKGDSGTVVKRTRSMVYVEVDGKGEKRLMKGNVKPTNAPLAQHSPAPHAVPPRPPTAVPPPPPAAVPPSTPTTIHPSPPAAIPPHHDVLAHVVGNAPVRKKSQDTRKIRQEVDMSRKRFRIDLVEDRVAHTKEIYIYKPGRGKDILPAHVPTATLRRLHMSVQYNGVMVFMPSKGRSGAKYVDYYGKFINHDTGNLLEDDHSSGLKSYDTVLIFVQRNEVNHYQQNMKLMQKVDLGTHVLVVLPDDWKGYGAPFVREVMKLFAEALYRRMGLQICLNMDDDVRKFEERHDSSTKGRELTARASLNFIRDVLDAHPRLLAFGPTPGRGALTTNYQDEKKLMQYSIKQCAGVFGFKIADCMAASFIPHRWFIKSKHDWEMLKEKRLHNDEIQQRYFQREDFRFCAQIADFDGKPNSGVASHLLVHYNNFPSQARTKND